MATAVPNPVRGALAGLAAGLIASFAMNQFQKLWTAGSSKESDGDPATVKAARKVDHAVTGQRLKNKDKEPAGEAVHYALGAALGVAYGVLAEYRPEVTTGFGTAFGAVTAVALDEMVVPAVGLGDPPWKTPLRTHAYGMASHLVFGAVAEGTRAAIRTVS